MNIFRLFKNKKNKNQRSNPNVVQVNMKKGSVQSSSQNLVVDYSALTVFESEDIVKHTSDWDNSPSKSSWNSDDSSSYSSSSSSSSSSSYSSSSSDSGGSSSFD